MKIVIAILLIIGVSITAHSQNFESFSKLFSEIKVPYIIPEGSYFGYTNDDAKRPVVGKAIDNATYKAIFGLDMETYSTWQAVGKITKQNYILFILFECRKDQWSGKEIRNYLIYTFSKTGDEIDFRPANSESEYQDDVIFATMETSCVISNGNTEEDKSKLLLTFLEKSYETALEGDYGVKESCEITRYELIEANGQIKNATTFILEED